MTIIMRSVLVLLFILFGCDNYEYKKSNEVSNNTSVKDENVVAQEEGDDNKEPDINICSSISNSDVDLLRKYRKQHGSIEKILVDESQSKSLKKAARCSLEKKKRALESIEKNAKEIKQIENDLKERMKELSISIEQAQRKQEYKNKNFRRVGPIPIGPKR